MILSPPRAACRLWLFGGGCGRSGFGSRCCCCRIVLPVSRAVCSRSLRRWSCRRVRQKEGQERVQILEDGGCAWSEDRSIGLRRASKKWWPKDQKQVPADVEGGLGWMWYEWEYRSASIQKVVKDAGELIERARRAKCVTNKKSRHRLLRRLAVCYIPPPQTMRCRWILHLADTVEWTLVFFTCGIPPTSKPA